MASTAQITVSSEAEEIGADLIQQYHPHLMDARILYLMTTQKRASKGKVVYGSAHKLNPMQRFLASGLESVEAGADFLLLFGGNEWEELTAAGRKALVDHELMHCWCDEESGAWTIRGHDVEEFGEILKRHGLWRDSLHAFAAEASRQLELFSDEAASMLEAIKAL